MENQKPILYAEDQENDIFLFERASKGAGVLNPLKIVQDGKEAIDYLNGAAPFGDRGLHPAPSLVLLDLKLPRKSGFEVLEWVRQQPELRMLPIVIFTSSAHDHDVHRAYALGANAYLVKPSSLDKLSETVKAIKDFWLTLNRIPPFRRDKEKGRLEL